MSVALCVASCLFTILQSEVGESHCQCLRDWHREPSWSFRMQRAPLSRCQVFSDTLYTQTTMLVNWDRGLIKLIVWNGDLFVWFKLAVCLFAGCPHRTNALPITHLVEDSIRCQHQKIMLSRYPELIYGWLARDDIRVATSTHQLSFRVTERSAHWESTR